MKCSDLGKQLYRQTGTLLPPMSLLVKIKWLKETQPELTKKAAYYIGIKEYIFYCLFQQLICDYIASSGTGYFDIHQFNWTENVLKYLSINKNQLPQLVPPTTKIN